MKKKFDKIRHGVRSWLRKPDVQVHRVRVVVQNEDDLPQELRDFINALRPKSDYDLVSGSVAMVKDIENPDRIVTFDDLIHHPVDTVGAFSVDFKDGSRLVVVFEEHCPYYSISSVGKHSTSCMFYLDWLCHNR